MTVAITGANGHIGRRLIRVLQAHGAVRAIVRSARARDSVIRELGDDVDLRIVDYADADVLEEALDGVSQVVHLVGIIKESRSNPFELAHERACEALVKAARGAGIHRLVHLSVLGADSASTNACFASRGRADEILLAGGIPATILRVPMVLGEGDYASAALLHQSRRRFALTFRAESLEQPIYAADVVGALEALSRPGDIEGIVELGGPESLTRARLIRRAARITGGSPRVVSLPLSLGYFLAAIAERSRNPPITRAMLGVLDHDDRVDVAGACQSLGLELTSLDAMLERIARTNESQALHHTTGA